MIEAQGGSCRLNAAKKSSTSDGFVRSTRMKSGEVRVSEHDEQVGHIFLSCKGIGDGWCMRWNSWKSAGGGWANNGSRATE